MRTRALVNLCVVYTDGNIEIFCTDGTWRAATGSILGTGFLSGETCDPAFEPEGKAGTVLRIRHGVRTARRRCTLHR